MRRVYLCDPSKNAECRKTSCQIDCFYTTHKEFEQKNISESRLTTLEEEIKKFRSIAEAAKRQSERNLVSGMYEQQWKQKALELARKNFQLADYLECLKEIWESGDCNDCLHQHNCTIKPKLGQLVRFNCYQYERGSDSE